MGPKTFNVISLVAMILAITTSTLSIIGIAVTGYYPGIGVLSFLAVIPIASRFYAKRIINRSNSFHRKYYTTLTIINFLLIFVVLMMTFVIVHDRVLKDCC